jgi:hypothetical protein
MMFTFIPVPDLTSSEAPVLEIQAVVEQRVDDGVNAGAPAQHEGLVVHQG